MTTTAAAGPADMLRAASLRVTKPRLAVLAHVREHPHVDVDDIATGVRTRLGSVSTQAVYDVLRTLTGVGLLRRIEPAGSPARYEARVGDNHHHVVCRVCGAIRDVACVTGSAPCLDPDEDHGFRIDEAEVTFWGLCADCRTEFDGGQPTAVASDQPSHVPDRQEQS